MAGSVKREEVRGKAEGNRERERERERAACLDAISPTRGLISREHAATTWAIAKSSVKAGRWGEE
jgi:hypothetical protein